MRKQLQVLAMTVLILFAVGVVSVVNEFQISDEEDARSLEDLIPSHFTFIKTATHRFLKKCEMIDDNSIKEYFLYYGSYINCPQNDGEYNKYVDISGILRRSDDQIKFYFSFDKKTVKYKSTILSRDGEVMIERELRVDR